MKTTRINPVSRRAEPFVPAWSRFGRTVFAGEELANFSWSSLFQFSSVQLLNNFVNFRFISFQGPLSSFWWFVWSPLYLLSFSLEWLSWSFCRSESTYKFKLPVIIYILSKFIIVQYENSHQLTQVQYKSNALSDGGWTRPTPLTKTAISFSRRL